MIVSKSSSSVSTAPCAAHYNIGIKRPVQKAQIAAAVSNLLAWLSDFVCKTIQHFTPPAASGTPGLFFVSSPGGPMNPIQATQS
jgi:hypothetical protein